jgi:hypothetical protein
MLEPSDIALGLEAAAAVMRVEEIASGSTECVEWGVLVSAEEAVVLEKATGLAVGGAAEEPIVAVAVLAVMDTKP